MSKGVIRIVLGVVIFLLLLLILLRNRSPFGKGNSSFASEPASGITRIEFSQAGNSLTLEKDGENWLLNGRNKTRKSGILFIIRVLEEIKIKSPVSPELFESEITAKGVEPVRVKVFERRKLIKSFYVYKTGSNVYGNIMKMRSGSKPFIVYIPGFEGDIGSAFTDNELFWQPYTIFNLLPSEIASVDFESLADTSNSFSILNKNHIVNLTDRRNNISGWDTSLVKRYLSYFTMIPFESWALDLGAEEKSKIESERPLYRITVEQVKGTVSVLTLWEKKADEVSSRINDSDRMFGKTGDREELFIIRYFDIDPLLKKRSYFFPR